MLQLANLPDNELMARARRLKDEEAAGILLERYSHLLAAVSLPSLNSYDNTPEEFFPSLLQRLFYSLQTQTIPKIGEWMQFFIKSHSNRTAKNTFYFPSSASSEITRLEYKVEKANSDLLQKQQLTSTMNTAFYQLETDIRELLEDFYLQQKTFAEIAAERGYTIEEVRKQLKRCKQELASQVLSGLEHAKTSKQVQEMPAQPEYPPQDTRAGQEAHKSYTKVVKLEDLILEQETVPGYTNAEKQEQDEILQKVINPGYAKFGKQGQDIKDLQQGTLF